MNLLENTDGVLHHCSLGVAACVPSLDPDDARCIDDVIALQRPKGLGEEGFPGTRWQMLYMLLAGPSYPTDRKGGNVYEAEFPMEAQDLDTIVGGSGETCCGQSV